MSAPKKEGKEKTNTTNNELKVNNNVSSINESTISNAAKVNERLENGSPICFDKFDPVQSMEPTAISFNSNNDSNGSENDAFGLGQLPALDISSNITSNPSLSILNVSNTLGGATSLNGSNGFPSSTVSSKNPNPMNINSALESVMSVDQINAAMTVAAKNSGSNKLNDGSDKRRNSNNGMELGDKKQAQLLSMYMAGFRAAAQASQQITLRENFAAAIQDPSNGNETNSLSDSVTSATQKDKDGSSTKMTLPNSDLPSSLNNNNNKFRSGELVNGQKQKKLFFQCLQH